MGVNDAYIAPFPTARISGYDFGARVPAGGWTGTGSDFGWPVHLGTDFGTPAGEPIVASAPATVKFQTGLPGYGNLLTETFDNGYQLLFGHVAAGSSGRVAPGQQIGVTGRNVGSSQGAVTLVQLKTPSGQSVNPDAFIASLSGRVAGDVAQSSEFWRKAAGLDPISQHAQDLLEKSIGLQQVAIQQAALGQVAQGIGLTNIADSLSAIPTQVGHGLADFFAVSEQNIAEWLKRQSVAFFVAAVVLLVLFL